jgi:hypothetical protein
MTEPAATPVRSTIATALAAASYTRVPSVCSRGSASVRAIAAASVVGSSATVVSLLKKMTPSRWSGSRWSANARAAAIASSSLEPMLRLTSITSTTADCAPSVEILRSSTGSPFSVTDTSALPSACALGSVSTYARSGNCAVPAFARSSRSTAPAGLGSATTAASAIAVPMMPRRVIARRPSYARALRW